MQMELDFIQEGQSGERIKALLSHRPDIYIPDVVWKLSTGRILVTEFIHGCKINNVRAIKQMRIRPQSVFNSFASAFGEMVFSIGFVHCDPHPGNALVRRTPPPPPYVPRFWLTSPLERLVHWMVSFFRSKRTSSYQVVLLDHGLYRELTVRLALVRWVLAGLCDAGCADPLENSTGSPSAPAQDDFRMHFSNLWRAMYRRDDATLKHEAEALGFGEFWSLLPLILLLRMPGSKAAYGCT